MIFVESSRRVRNRFCLDGGLTIPRARSTVATGDFRFTVVLAVCRWTDVAGKRQRPRPINNTQCTSEQHCSRAYLYSAGTGQPEKYWHFPPQLSDFVPLRNGFFYSFSAQTD